MCETLVNNISPKIFYSFQRNIVYLRQNFYNYYVKHRHCESNEINLTLK